MRWAGSAIRGDFYPMLIWNLQSHFNQKVCYVAGKNCFDQVVFKILYYLIIIWKKKQKKTLIKENSIRTGRAGTLARVPTENLHLTLVRSRQNQMRSQLGGLAHFSYEHIIFLQGFFKEAEISPGTASSPNGVS